MESRILFSIEISNRLDDTCRHEILSVDANDKDKITYISEMAEQFVNLSDYSEDYISNIRVINPIII